MSKYFLYIDESKQLQNGILMLWGFLSRNNKESCNKVISEAFEEYKIWNLQEIKSTSKYWKGFIEKWWIEYLKEKGIIERIVATISYDYYRDSYEWYKATLIKLIDEVAIRDEIIAVYIDYLPLVKNRKDIQLFLERDICPIYTNILKITPEISSSQRCIQISDLIMGEIRKYYLYRENISLESVFPTVSKKITTKKIS